MIVLSYGMTKSGSTLAFELCKAVLEQRGYGQRRLPDAVVTEGHHINFLTKVTVPALRGLIAEVREDEIVAVKIHSAIGKGEQNYIDSAVSDGKIKVHVNYRDPREISLSLMDAGRKARENDRKAFSEIRDFEDAAAATGKQLTICRRWGSLKGALHLFYNDVAFDMRATAVRLTSDFNLESLNDDEYKAVVDCLDNEAFTQKNKAVKDRYKDELTLRQNEVLLEKMPGSQAFIRRVCERRDYSWFGNQREATVE